MLERAFTFEDVCGDKISLHG